MTDRTAAEQAVEALRPFASIADKLIDQDEDNPINVNWPQRHHTNVCHLTPKEFRRAAEALAALTAEVTRARDFELAKLSQGAELVAARVSPDREALGRVVREAWIKWALQQPNPKPSWLVPWEGLSEPDKEVDRQIAEAVVASLPPAVGEWRPTHRHYKGGLYRVVARGKIEADLSPVVIYDNDQGETWVRPVRDFEEYLMSPESDRSMFRRFDPLPPASPQEKP